VWAGAVDGLRNWRGDLANDVVLARQPGVPGACDKIVVGGLGGILDDDSPGVPYFPNVKGQGAGVDTRDRRDSMAREVLMNGSGRTAMARSVGVLADNEARNPRLSRFVRLGMDPVVPNQGICHAHNLAAE
jgi:hypothetical protein